MSQGNQQRKTPSFETVNSNAHDDRCLCPGCSGLCQDDYEYYAGIGPYAADEVDDEEQERLDAEADEAAWAYEADDGSYGWPKWT